MKRHYYTLILAVLLLSSCSKDESKYESTNPDFLVSYSNPFDSIGGIHNDFIDYHKAQLSLDSNARQIENKISLASSFLEELNDTTTLEEYFIYNPNAKDMLLKQYSDDFSTENGIHSLDSLYYFGYMTKNIYNYNRDLFVTLRYSAGINDIKNKISELETSVYQDNSLSQQEKDGLLLCYSISKASIDYWEDNTPPGNFTVTDWVSRDVGGACFSLTSGWFEYGMLFGPWGGAAAMVGCAAIMSAVG